MSKKNPTQAELRSSMYESKLEEVRLIELQARFWKANFELKDFYLKDKAITEEYNESVKSDLEKFASSQEAVIREVDPTTLTPEQLS